MKIIYYFGDQDIIMHRWPSFHFYNELGQYGIDVELFNPLKYPTLKDANVELIKRIDQGDVSLFITPHNEERLFISTLEKIKKRGVATLLKCYDNLTLPFFHKKIAPHFDLVWLTSIETQYMFSKWGAETVFLPYAANPFNFKPEENVDNGKICFIGTPYGSRVNMINSITNCGVKVDLYSGLNSKSTSVQEIKSAKLESFINLSKFSYGRKMLASALIQKLNQPPLMKDNISFYPPVQLKDMSSLYSNYALSLSSSAARNTGILEKPVHIVNLRAFEIPMAGGLQLCSYNPELAEYFKEDEEIVFYRNQDDLKDKLDYYLKEENYGLRMKMKANARVRAERDHTWMNRYEKVFDLMGIEFSR